MSLDLRLSKPLGCLGLGGAHPSFPNGMLKSTDASAEPSKLSVFWGDRDGNNENHHFFGLSPKSWVCISLHRVL